MPALPSHGCDITGVGGLHSQYTIAPPRLKMYGLRGKKVSVIWRRDKQNTWMDELEGGKAPETLPGERVPFDNCTLDCYLPWEDRRMQVKAPTLPPFRRSIVIRVPISAVVFEGGK